MTSPAQIAANQRNAELSTGPKTSEGKAVSSKNAQKHGLLAADLVLPDEHASEYTELADGLDRQLCPQGDLEKALVERIVGLLWRLRRAGMLENAILFWHHLRAADEWPLSGDKAVDFIRRVSVRGEAFVTRADSLAKLSRYESTMQRNLLRMMHELQRLQATRKGEHVPVPHAIDLDVTGMSELRGAGDERD